MDKPDGQTDHQQSNSNSRHEDEPTTAIKSPKNNSDISASHTQNSQTKRKPTQETKLWKKLKETSITDRIMAGGTIVIAVATTIYTIISIGQWRIMREQTVASFQQLSTAKASIRIAENTLSDARKSGEEQSAKAERLTKANEKISDAASRSADAMAKSVEQGKASLEASTKQAQAALDASRETAGLDQRAWVGLVGVETVGGEQTSDAFSFKSIIVAIRNSGKTPALKLSGECCMYVNRPWTDPIPDYDTETKMIEEERRKHDEERRKRNEEEIKRHPEFADRIREFEQSYSQATERKIPTGGVLAPGIVNNISVAPSMKFGRTRKPGEAPQTLYVIGRFTYTDIFTGTQRHSSKFCLMYTGGDSFNICPESNWMD